MLNLIQMVALIIVVLGAFVVASSADNPDTESNLHDYLVEKRQIGCEDKYDSAQCAGWAAGGECENNPFWMYANCRKSCDVCGCEDKYDSAQCAGWAAAGECEKNPLWMYPMCRKSCGVCDCMDKNTECSSLSYYNGDCISDEIKPDTNPPMTKKQWMKENCPFSCLTCEGKCLDNLGPNQLYYGESCTVWSMCGYCDRQPVIDKCPRTCAQGCGAGRTIEKAPTTCQDWLPTDTCIKYAKAGTCKSNFYMQACMATCGGCEWLEWKHDDECAFEDCEQFKQEGLCEISTCFMERFCAPVCQGRVCKNRKDFTGPKVSCTVTGTCGKQRKQ